MRSIVCSLLLVAALTSAARAQVWVLDIDKLDHAERVAATAIQGLANRQGPHVYLQPGGSNPFMMPKREALPAALASMRSVADDWMAYCRRVHKLTFEPVADLAALLGKVSGVVKGAVLYDPGYPGDFEVGVTQAGLLDAVPVTAKLRQSVPALTALPVVFDTTVAHGQPELARQSFDLNPAEWAGGQVTVTREGDLARFALKGDATEPYSAAARRIELPFHAVSGKVVIEVPRAEGQWSLKISRPGAGDEVIQRDTDATGRFEFDLSTVPNWQGEREISLHLWIIGRGKSVWVRSVRAELSGGAQAPKEPLYDWALTNLLPRCSRDGLYSYCEAIDDFALDVAVAQRLFVYDLSHALPETVHEDYVREWLEKRPGGLHPPGAKQLDRILAHPKPLSPVWGWGKPSEQSYLFRVSRAGLFVECGQVPNLSFLAALRPARAAFRQRHITPAEVKLETKVYVAFMVNEGDTAKCAGSLYNGGSWLQADRGKLPINWGMSPYLCERFPAVMQRFYAEATPNDCFFIGPSGYGYAAPTFLPPAVRNLFAQRTRDGAKLADAPFADLWYFYPLNPEAERLRWLASMGLQGVSLWHKDQRVTYPEGCPPLVHSNHYYEEGSPGQFVDKLRRETDGVQGPWFTLLYAGDPSWFAGIARLLPPERFKVVRLDELYQASRLARAQVEGKVVAPVK
ncbi:MAG: hypothetical protein HZB16_20765 [Armatimonadetes bacterium]|nr:hypothetical protein [Armatimonadota bacterium]